MESDSDVEAERSSRVRGGKYSALRADLSAALSAFDRAQDWADLIHDLQRVNRVLVKHDSGSFIPDKVLLAKRLAQCLTASLPSGVHLKALETYHIVFSRIGSARLAKDLLIYSAGPFPLYSYAATSLKGALLSMYETHFLPLGRALRPIADGFVMALLPGLEDESSEYYERTRELLNRVEAAVDSPHVFHSALWRALWLMPSVRLAAAAFLQTKVSALDVPRDYGNVMRDSALIARAVSDGLRDSQVLVQRATLELLVGSFPLDVPVIAEHKEEIVSAVLETLLRRDLSLTKRVHAWLLGGNDGPRGTEYCRLHARDALVSCLRKQLHSEAAAKDSESPSQVTKPYKIIGALLDREEIAECAVPDLTFAVLQSAAMNSEHRFRRERDHAIREVVSQVGNNFVFDILENRIQKPGPVPRDEYRLISVSLSFLPMQEPTIRQDRVTRLTSLVIASMAHSKDDTDALFEATEVLLTLLGNLGKTVLQKDKDEDLKLALLDFARQFDTWLGCQTLDGLENDTAKEDKRAAFVSSASLLLSGVSHRVGIETAMLGLESGLRCSSATDARIKMAGMRAFVEISPSIVRTEELKLDLDQRTLKIVQSCWDLLAPHTPTASVQSAELWFAMQRRFAKVASSVVADGILSPEVDERVRNLEIFVSVWKLVCEHHLGTFPADSGIYLMLEAVNDENFAVRTVVRGWLKYALEFSPSKVLDAALRLILTSETATQGSMHTLLSTYDCPRVLYAFRLLHATLNAVDKLPKSNSPDGPFGDVQPSSEILAAMTQIYGAEDENGIACVKGLMSEPDYMSVLAICAVGFIRSQEPEEQKPQESEDSWMFHGLGAGGFRSLHASVKIAAAEFLGALLARLPQNTEKSLRLSEKLSQPVLKLLSSAVDKREVILQMRLIEVVENLLGVEGPGIARALGASADTSTADEIRTSSLEASEFFGETLLQGLSSSVKPVLYGAVGFYGSESLGLSKRWLSFCCFCVSYAGASLPRLAESLLTAMCDLVVSPNRSDLFETHTGRLYSVDHGLDVLEAISKVSSQVLSSFESAATRGALIDESGEARPQSTTEPKFGGTAAFSNGTGEVPRSTASTPTTASALTSMNPLKIFNDFVKDVFIGNGPEHGSAVEDPRREATRTLFQLLPRVVATALKVWRRHPSAHGVAGEHQGPSARRAAVLHLLQPWLERHPVDLLAAFVVLWSKIRVVDEVLTFKVVNSQLDQSRVLMVEVLETLARGDPSKVITSLATLVEITMKWNENSAAAIAGRQRRIARQRSEGQVPAESNLEQEMPRGPLEHRDTPEHNLPTELFSAGDLFAENDVVEIELSALSLMNAFLQGTRVDEDSETVPIWNALHPMFRDIVTSSTRPLSQILLLPVLASFASLASNLTSEKRNKKDFSHLCGQVISSCSSVATGSSAQNSVSIVGELARVRSSFGVLKESRPSTLEERQRFLMIRALCVMPSNVYTLLDKGFGDDRATSTNLFAGATNPCLHALKTLSLKRASRPLWVVEGEKLALEASAQTVLEAAECHWSLKVVRKEFMSFLEDSEFFRGKSASLMRSLARLCNAVLGPDKGQVTSLGSASNAPSVVSGGLTAVFAGRDSEIALRSRALRRMAFCVLAGEYEAYKPYSGTLLEKLRDSLKMGSSELSVDTFLCLRVLLLRAGSSSIAPFRATTLGELTRILQEPYNDVRESFAALRYLDLLMLLRPAEFAHERCLFFAESRDPRGEDAADGEGPVGFKPLVSDLAEGGRGEGSFEGSREESRWTRVFRKQGGMPVAGGRVDEIDEVAVRCYGRALVERVTIGTADRVDMNIVENDLLDEFVEDVDSNIDTVMGETSEEEMGRVGSAVTAPGPSGADGFT